MEIGGAVTTFDRDECMTVNQLCQAAARIADRQRIPAHDATEIILQRHIELIESQRDARDTHNRMLGGFVVSLPESE